MFDLQRGVAVHVSPIIALDSNTEHRLYQILFHHLPSPPPPPSFAQQGALLKMVHASNNSGSFRSLTRYEEYYISGGDLFFLVRHHRLIRSTPCLSVCLSNCLVSRWNITSLGCIGTSLNVRVDISGASLQPPLLPVLPDKAQVKPTPSSWTMSRSRSLHGSFGCSIIRE